MTSLSCSPHNCPRLVTYSPMGARAGTATSARLPAPTTVTRQFLSAIEYSIYVGLGRRWLPLPHLRRCRGEEPRFLFRDGTVTIRESLYGDLAGGWRECCHTDKKREMSPTSREPACQQRPPW